MNGFIDRELIDNARQVVLRADYIEHSIILEQDRKRAGVLLKDSSSGFRESVAEILGDPSKPSHADTQIDTQTTQLDLDNVYSERAHVKRLCLTACREQLGEEIAVQDLVRPDVRAAMQSAVSTIDTNPIPAVNMFLRHIGRMAIATTRNEHGEDVTERTFTHDMSALQLSNELSA